MKTIELTIKFSAEVEDEVADDISRDENAYSSKVDLERMHLRARGWGVPVKFVAFQTMKVEVLD